MKILLKIIVIILLVYSVVMMLINVLYSTLSLSETYDKSVFFKEQFLPSICGIISMLYCLFSLFRRKNQCDKWWDCSRIIIVIIVPQSKYIIIWTNTTSKIGTVLLM